MEQDMWVLSTQGAEIVAVDIPDRSRIGSHWNAVQRFLTTGDSSPLEEFRGQEAGGVVLETDPRAIEEAWRQRQLDFLEIYG